MNAIEPSMYLANQDTTRTPNPNMDKEGFLKVLMTQLQNQDPSKPMDSQAMVDQMTSLSTLEQIINMTDSIESLISNQMVSPVIQYSHMIGKEVSYPSSGEESDSGIATSNVVAVTQAQGLAILELENGDQIYTQNVMKVSAPDAN